jgi:hypothetical protein
VLSTAACDAAAATPCRHNALSRLLCASCDEMTRICRVFPNLLGRDPTQLDANITQLAQQLGLPKVMTCHFGFQTMSTAGCVGRFSGTAWLFQRLMIPYIATAAGVVQGLIACRQNMHSA